MSQMHSWEKCKRILDNLEKYQAKNRETRLEYPDNPKKWVKTEVDLDESLTKLKTFTTETDIFLDFADYGGITLLASLLSHPNTDITIRALNLLADFCDADQINELDDRSKYIGNIMESLVLEAFTELVHKFDESNDEERNAITKIFEILEDLLDVEPSLADNFYRRIKLFKWILTRLRHGAGNNYNRIYASEILVSILQNSEICRKWFSEDENGGWMNKILRTIAEYRTKGYETPDEEELVENCYGSLCTLMLIPENQDILRDLDGLELLIYIIREKKNACTSALRMISFALQKNQLNCNYFVEKLGLGLLFPRLMRSHRISQKTGVTAAPIEEYLCSIIYSLLRHCSDQNLERVIHKFFENEGEKIEKMLEIRGRFQKKN